MKRLLAVLLTMLTVFGVMTVPSFQSYAANKGLTAKYCDPYTYFDLIKQSNQGFDL